MSSNYTFSSLTAEIDNKRSPLRIHLQSRFPYTRDITTPYVQASPALQVPSRGGVNPGTVGTAFDILIGLRYHPLKIPANARHFALGIPDLSDGWVRMLDEVAADETLREAAAWAYALAVEAYRSGIVPFAIQDLLEEKGGYNEYDLLAIASADACATLAELDDQAADNLYRHLGSPVEPPELAADLGWRHTQAWVSSSGSTKPPADGPVFAPTFAASRFYRADADVISGGILFEIKTRMGRKRKDGAHADPLPTEDLYQMVGYVLFDTADRYAIDTVALYSARYGRLTCWPVRDLLECLAGRAVDLAEERALISDLLGQHSA